MFLGYFYRDIVIDKIILKCQGVLGFATNVGRDQCDRPNNHIKRDPRRDRAVKARFTHNRHFSHPNFSCVYFVLTSSVNEVAAA